MKSPALALACMCQTGDDSTVCACVVSAETDLEAEVDPSVETEEKLRAEEEAARQRLQAMQRCAGWCRID